jgi:ubiquinone/menaquinone biosynthesis C-methylase UbiE
MTDLKRIAQVYDRGTEAEYQRLKKTPAHEAEFELTVDLLLEYIPSGSKVMDVGSGPGRYSQFLIEELGCKVGLVDLSAESLDAFNHRLNSNLRDRVLFTEVASATALDWVDAESFDAILLMGPLYHLLDETERRAAVKHCFRILKKGGHVFAAFLSPYVRLIKLLDNDGAALMDQDYVEGLFDRGTTRVQELTLDWHHCWPAQAVRLIESAGFEIIRVRNLQGIGSVLDSTQKQALSDPEIKKMWFDILRKTCENPDLLGATIHFLCFGKKPD